MEWLESCVDTGHVGCAIMLATFLLDGKETNLNCKNASFILRNVVSKIYTNHLQNQAIQLYKKKKFHQAFIYYLELGFLKFDIGRVNANILLDKFHFDKLLFKDLNKSLFEFTVTNEKDINWLLDENSDLSSNNMISFISTIHPEFFQKYLKIKIKTKKNSNKKADISMIKKFSSQLSNWFDLFKFSNYSNYFLRIIKRINIIGLYKHKNRFGVVNLLMKDVQSIENHIFNSKKNLFFNNIFNFIKHMWNPQFYLDQAEIFSTIPEIDDLESVQLQLLDKIPSVFSQEYYSLIKIKIDGMIQDKFLRSQMLNLYFLSKLLIESPFDKQEYLNSKVNKLYRFEEKEFFVKEFINHYMAYGYYFYSKYFEFLGELTHNSCEGYKFADLNLELVNLIRLYKQIL